MTWPTSNPVSRELEDFWIETQTLIQQWWVEADIDIKMLTSQQNSWANSYGVNNNNSNNNGQGLQFNKMLRVQNMIEGFQRDNRLASIINPGDNDPDNGQVATERNTALQWICREDMTYEKVSDCFGGAIACGLNLQQVWMDPRQDPSSPDIKTERFPYSSFVMDNYWTKPDLSDCNRIWTRKYVSAKQLKSLVPGIDKELPSLMRGYQQNDGKFQFMPQNYQMYNQNMATYDEYWTRDYKYKRFVLDKSTGNTVPWKGTKEQFELFKRIYPNIDIVKLYVPTIKRQVLINNHLHDEEQSPWGLDRFPFVPYLCYHYTEVQNYSSRYQGILRALRDPQVELNRRRNRLLDIIDAQVQSGFLIKEDALVNPEDAFLQGPGKVLFFKQSTNLATDVVPIPAPAIPAGWEELIMSVEKEIMDTVGPEELFAQNLGTKEMTGVLMKLKQGAGLTGLRNIFDKLNMSQKMLAEIQMDLMLNNWDETKITKILGKPPSEGFFDTEMFRYTCTVDEEELTNSQRQLQFLQATQIEAMYPGTIPKKYIIDKSALQGKKEIQEYIEKQEQQAQQMQQMQFQAEMQQSQVLARSLEAKAQSDFARAKEQDTRAVSNIALAKEHESQGIHARAKASLDNAKAIKEMAAMNDDRILKMANFALEVQRAQNELVDSMADDSTKEAEAIGASRVAADVTSKPSPAES